MAFAAFEFEVREAVGADSSLIPHASRLHFLADSIVTQVKPAFAGNAFVFIVSLAIFDLAISIVQVKRPVAFRADVVDFLPATQHQVADAEIVDQAVVGSAGAADGAGLVCVGEAILDGSGADSAIQNEARGTVDADSLVVLLKTAKDVGLLAFAIDEIESGLAHRASSAGCSDFAAILSGLRIEIAQSVAEQRVSVIADLAPILTGVLVAPLDVLGRDADTLRIGH